MSTWWGDSKNMEEIEFSQWLYEGRLRQCKNVLPDGLNWLCYFAGSSKSHSENSISFRFWESPHQVDMKNVVKYWKDFLFYFTTLETYRVRVSYNNYCPKYIWGQQALCTFYWTALWAVWALHSNLITVCIILNLISYSDQLVTNSILIECTPTLGHVLHMHFVWLYETCRYISGFIMYKKTFDILMPSLTFKTRTWNINCKYLTTL